MFATHAPHHARSRDHSNSQRPTLTSEAKQNRTIHQPSSRDNQTSLHEVLRAVADGDHGQRVPNVAAGLCRKLKLNVVAAVPHRLHAEQAVDINDWKANESCTCLLIAPATGCLLACPLSSDNVHNHGKGSTQHAGAS